MVNLAKMWKLQSFRVKQLTQVFRTLSLFVDHADEKMRLSPHNCIYLDLKLDVVVKDIKWRLAENDAMLWSVLFYLGSLLHQL